MPIPRAILEQIKRIIPPLDGSLHKGQSGRVGVLGGAMDYTGAPFFAAFSALRFGADLSHVICSPTAAGAIKSYSPDLIVHPILSESSSAHQVVPQLESLLSRLHVLIVGPGLGREPYMQSYAKLAISMAREKGMYLVIDADGLFLVGKELSIIRGYRRAVLTPNVVEFKRLSEQVGVSPEVPLEERASRISKKLGGVTILEKGATDIIAVDTTGSAASLEQSKLDGADEERERTDEVIKVDVQGGYKRVGGQGDCYEDGAFGDKTVPASRVPILAAVGGSIVTREASRRAFAKMGRGLVTQDLIPELGHAFAEHFGSDAQGGKL
ncbi:H-hydrate dehydratase [Ephemerocybe angulata]|uniref:ATP-dependent (S)-NAD(P)H-hydrate dehydratase n=1 Tax=Ephemerocybe angulata TaxID=980116 RepID=A0A8H6MF40_9AGAR|nr:H-hydrate dehydratase [Tulosesus angulatus]